MLTENVYRVSGDCLECPLLCPLSSKVSSSSIHAANLKLRSEARSKG